MRTPISVAAAAQSVLDALSARPTSTWLTTRLPDSEWTAWGALEHVLTCHDAYASLCTEGSTTTDWVNTVKTFEEEDIDDALQAIIIGARMLDTIVAAAPETWRAFHPYGVSDPEGFAAMGTVEMLVHGWDIVTALHPGTSWTVPDDLAASALERLFPNRPDGAAGEVLLHCCGRIPLGDRPRQHQWRWDGTVRTC